jgi:hypothetical protein
MRHWAGPGPPGDGGRGRRPANWRAHGKLRAVLDYLAGLLNAQPAPTRAVVLATALVGLVAVVPRPVWRVTRNAITIAHEGGHAVVALLTGRRLRGIRLHSDTSGLTVSAGRPTGFGMVCTLLAGYGTPSLLGLAGALVLTTGRITLLLGAALVLLPLMLVMIRNVFGVVSVVTTWALVFVVAWFTSPTVQGLFAYAAVWFLLLGGVRPVFELNRSRRRGRMPNSDADQIARLTRVPALAWVGVFLVVGAVALLAGTWLLARWLLP